MTNAADIDSHPVVVGITGASGSLIALHTIDALLDNGVPVVASASSAARIVWKQEMEESFGEALERWDGTGIFSYHAVSEIAAPIASGTFPTKRHGAGPMQHGDGRGGVAGTGGQSNPAGGGRDYQGAEAPGHHSQGVSAERHTPRKPHTARHPGSDHHTTGTGFLSDTADDSGCGGVRGATHATRAGGHIGTAGGNEIRGGELGAGGRFVERLAARFGVEATSVPGLYLGGKAHSALLSAFFSESLSLFLYLVVQILFRSPRHYHDSASQYEVSDYYDEYRVYDDKRGGIYLNL